MLKKRIHTQLNIIIKNLKDNFARQSEEHANTRSIINKLHGEYKSKLDSMSKTISSQQRTIEQLTNALKDKYEHGLFIFSEDCKIPMVIRNGKELTNDMTSCFSIEWVHGEAPNITIEQFAGTVSDSEL